MAIQDPFPSYQPVNIIICLNTSNPPPPSTAPRVFHVIITGQVWKEKKLLKEGGYVLLTIAEEEREECDIWLRLPSMFPPWIK